MQTPILLQVVDFRVTNTIEKVIMFFEFAVQTEFIVSQSYFEVFIYMFDECVANAN